MILRWAKENVSLIFMFITLSSAYLLPTSLELQGNKKRQPIKLTYDRSGTGYFYSSACEERIQRWTGWDGGLGGTILVKKKGDGAITEWTVVMHLNKPVTSLTSYDADSIKLDNRTYKLSPKQWNKEVKENAERTVSVQIKWPQGEAEPKIKYVEKTKFAIFLIKLLYLSSGIYQKTSISL